MQAPTFRFFLIGLLPALLRASNAHVRVEGSPNERQARLFRDHLRADAAVRDSWSAFKRVSRSRSM